MTGRWVVAGRVRRIALVVLGALVATTCATRADDPDSALSSPALVYVHDGLGRLRAVADPAGDMAVYSYDAVGNLLGISRQPADELSVVEVVPRRVSEGDEVTVWGGGFGLDPEDHKVRFGESAARVTDASPFRLTVVVPDGAESGPVSVERSGALATGAAAGVEVEVLDDLVPVVDGFSPTTVAPGEEVRIEGSNFTGDPLLDHVVVGGSTYATVTSASPSELVVTVPPTAPTGRLTVATPYGSARSEDVLVVAPLGYPADQVGDRTRVEIGSSARAEVATGRVSLVTFAGSQGQRIDLSFGEDGPGCGELDLGLADPAGVTLVDPHKGFLARTTEPGPWCGTGLESAEDAPSGLILPATGRYTLSLAVARGAGGTVDLTLAEVADEAPSSESAVTSTTPTTPGDEPAGAGAGLVEAGEVVAGAGGGVLDGVDWLPVDLATGALVLEQTDMVVADDLLPVTLTRSHWAVPSGPRLGVTRSDAAEFGLGAALEFDMSVQPSAALQFVELILPNGASVVFDRTSEGTDRAAAVFRHSTTPTGFFGASITWSGAGWDLRLPEGVVLEFAPEGPLRAVRDRNGNATTIRRDGELDVLGRRIGRLVTSIHSPTGRWVAFDYDDADRIITARNHLGDAVVYGYDGEGRLATVAYRPAGGGADPVELAYGYDERGLLTSVTRGAEQVTIGYDAAGRVAQQLLADGSGFTFAYATEDRPTEVEGVSLQAVTRAEVVDPRGTLRQVDFAAGPGWWTTDARAVGTPAEQVVTAERDPTGFVTAQVDPAGVRTGYRYDEDGNVVSVTGAEGSDEEARTGFAFDGPSELLDLVAVDGPAGRQDMAYDDAGNLVRSTSYAGVETRFRYDRRGRVRSVVDGAGGRTRVDYELGHRVTVTDPAGNSEAEFYDAAGRLAARTDALGNTTTYGYDGFDRVRTVVDPLQGTTGFEYDALGNVVAVTDAVGNRTAYTYDGLGRVVSRTDPAGAVDQFAYDALGNVVATTDRRGIRSTFTYDELGRLVVAAHGVDDGGAAESTVRYGYDAAGRLVQVEDTAYGTATFEYDELGRLRRESTPNGTVSYEYDAAGRRVRMGLDGEPDTVYRYDDRGFLASIGRGEVEVAAGRDPPGRVERLDFPDGVAALTHAYDARGAVTLLDYKADDGQATGDLTYRYDAAGRRVATGGELALPRLPRAFEEASYGRGNTIDRFDGSAASHDAAGNLRSADGVTYRWDARGRLVGVDGDVHAEFTYDPFGRRTTKTVDGEVTAYTYDGWNVVRTRTTDAAGAETTTATYLTGLGLDELFARIVDGEVTAYVTDVQGSVLALVGPDGEVTTRYRYDPFGGVRRRGDDDPNPFTYTGRELDETGLLYMRSRYYSPRQGRFISQDPIGFAGGDPNLYAYGSNDPATFTDPMGLAPTQSLVGLGACAVALTWAVRIYFDNFEELWALYDKNGDGVVDAADYVFPHDSERTDLILVTLDRHTRENLQAFEIAITICSIFLPGMGGLIGKGATSFGRAFSTRFPTLSTRLATRFPNASARVGLTANPLDDLAAYRASQGLPIAGSADDVATTARLDIGGSSFYGRSAHGQPITMTVNPVTASHAEAHVFQQALNAGASGRSATLYVDRNLCPACGANGGIGSLMRGAGVDELTVVTPGGRFLVTASRPSVPIPLGPP